MVSYSVRIIFFVLFNLTISFITYAKPIEEKRADFQIDLKRLLEGDTPFFIFSAESQQFSKNHPDLLKFDTLSMSKQKDVLMVFGKIEYIINKPVGLFEHEKLMDLNYISYVFKDHQIKALDKDSFIISKPDGTAYKMQSFFDSENMSTLNKFKVLNAANAARDLDIISEGATTMIITENTNFSKFLLGEVWISSFIPVTENRTLVITYRLSGHKKPFKNLESIKKDFIKDFQILRERQNSFHDRAPQT